MQSVPITADVVSSIHAQGECTRSCDKVCQWLVAGRCFSPCTPVSSINKTDHHNIAKIILKMALNTINQTNQAIAGKDYRSQIITSSSSIFNNKTLRSLVDQLIW